MQTRTLYQEHKQELYIKKKNKNTVKNTNKKREIHNKIPNKEINNNLNPKMKKIHKN